MGTSTVATETARVQALIGDFSAATLTELQAFAAEAYDEVVAVHNWKWLWFEGRLNLVPVYTTGTLSAAAGASALTGSGTTWTGQGFTNELVEVAAGTELYRGTITANTTFTLSDSGTVPAAIAAGTSYTMFQRRYALAARMRGTPVFSCAGGSTPSIGTAMLPLHIVGREEMEMNAQAPLITGTPDTLAFAGFDANGNQIVMVYPVPNEGKSLMYSGFRQTADITGASAFDFPKEILHAFRWLYRAKVWHWKRNFQQEAAARQQYEVTVARAIGVDAPDTGRGDTLMLDEAVYADWRVNGGRDWPPRGGYNNGW